MSAIDFIPNMSVGVGQDDQNNALTFGELDDTVCGPETETGGGVSCCGPRIYSINKELLTGMADFFSFESDTHKIEVKTTDRELIGSYPVEIEVSLELFVMVKTMINFEVEVTLCQPKLLKESFSAYSIFHKVGDPVKTYPMPEFT